MRRFLPVVLCILALSAVWVHAAAPAEELVPIPEPSPKAMAFYRSGNILWCVRVAWSMLVPALLLVSGAASRLRTICLRYGRREWVAAALFVAAYLAITFVADLPLNYYGYLRRHWYGLSDQALGKWLADGALFQLVNLAGALPVVWVGRWLLVRFEKTWWLIASALTVPLLAFVLFVQPIWIDPLFNAFGPMKNKELESQILQLAERAGVEGSRVFEVNKSVDTKMMNAYVAGFFKTKRIVLWDTLVNKLEPDEVLAVVGHEIGHYVLGHVRQIIWGGALLALVTLWLLARAVRASTRRFSARFGFSEMTDIAAIPLFILVGNLFYFALTPGIMALSRHNEFEADRFGLELTRKNHAAATTFVKFQTDDLGMPYHGLLFTLWRGSHPSLGDRIDFANRYRPWVRGEPLRYTGLFRDPTNAAPASR